MASNDILIHILDIQSRDVKVEQEDNERRIVFEEAPYDDEDEPRPKKSHADAKELLIHVFGATNDGKRVRIDVEGFRPTLYLLLPEVKTVAAVSAIRAYLTTQGIPLSVLTLKTIHRKKFYGFTANKLFPFLEITTPSLGLWRSIKNLFLNDQSEPATKKALGEPFKRGQVVEVYEANLDPMLRFLHVQGLNSCGWAVVKDAMELVEDLEADTWILTTPYSDVLPATSKTSAPFEIASWDIECFSITGDFPVPTKSEEAIQEMLKDLSGTDILDKFDKGGLGQLRAKKTRADLVAAVSKSKIPDLTNIIDFGDPVIQIGTTLTRDSKTLDRHLFVWPSCDPIEDITVHVFKDEQGMIEGWFEWLVEVNPDILIGYNVFGFDERYLWGRADELGLTGPRSPVHGLNRLLDTGAEVKCEEKRLSSSAMGDNFLYIMTTQGRLQIDLFHYIKRNNASLPSYKLDEVTKYYLSGKLKKAEKVGSDLRLTLSGSIKDLRVGRAVCLLEDTGESLTDKMVIKSVDGPVVVVDWPLREGGSSWKPKGSRNESLSNSSMDEFDNGEVLEESELPLAIKWVVVKDDVSPADIFRLHRGSAADRAIVGKYCLQDCDLVIELYRNLEVFNNSLSMANVCCVPIGYIFTRGQGIKAESLMFRACRQKDILIPVLPAPKQAGEEQDSYEGAIVFDPIPGFYSKAPIGVADFASLYPSSMESENISHDSLVWTKDYDSSGNLMAVVFGSDEYDGMEGYGYTDIEFDLLRKDPEDKRKHYAKIKAGTRICRYAQPLDGSKATVPDIIRGLLATRKAKRKEKAKETDPARQALLEAEQLAYKLTANSLYGQLGSGTFKVRLQHLAASITAYGRKQIMFANDVIKHFYGPEAKNPKGVANVMYGDTDSLFIEFTVLDSSGQPLKGREARQAVMDLTAEAGHLVTKALKAPHDFEFDKIFDPMLMFSKKRYAGLMYEENADDYVTKYMGIALKRRDNAPIVKTIFGSSMRKLLMERDVVGATRLVQDSCMDLVNGKVKLGQLTITKSLRADYADASRIAHKALADRMAERDPGSAPSSGDRIPYIYVRPPPGSAAAKLQGDRIEAPSWIKAHNLVPDYEFYVTNQLQNPISQMFGLLLDEMPGSDDLSRVTMPDPSETDKYLRWCEEAAADLLFNKALQVCNKQHKSAFISTFFNVKSGTVTKSSTSKQMISSMSKQSKQQTMNNYMIDSFLVNKINQKKAAERRAATALATALAKEAEEAKEEKTDIVMEITKPKRSRKKNINEIVANN
uniref:DNA-directed DNA polymerase n=1 Tax=viral metagenome TaxID=1070528 RepID=A0A6C0DGX0_9ZZZZ